MCTFRRKTVCLFSSVSTFSMAAEAQLDVSMNLCWESSNTNVNGFHRSCKLIGLLHDLLSTSFREDRNAWRSYTINTPNSTSKKRTYREFDAWPQLFRDVAIPQSWYNQSETHIYRLRFSKGSKELWMCGFKTTTLAWDLPSRTRILKDFEL